MLTTLLLAATLAVAPAECAPLDADAAVASLRTCFVSQVMPQLTRAETDEKVLSQAATDLFRWGRQAALFDLLDDVEPEWQRGTASLERGVEHAYRVAHDRCVRLRDSNQVPIMLDLVRWAQLLGMEIGETLGDDIEACLGGFRYMVEMSLESESTRRGPGSSYRYTAFLAPDPEDPDALIGTGVYTGWLVAHDANCADPSRDEPQRFTVWGKLESSGGIIDMAAPGAKPDPHMMFVLGTTDWPLKPIWGGDGPFARTAEEREGVKGLGTATSGRPVKLIGDVTTWSNTATQDGDKCSGTRTSRTSIRITRLERPDAGARGAIR